MTGKSRTLCADKAKDMLWLLKTDGEIVKLNFVLLKVVTFH